MDTALQKFGIYDFLGIWGPGALTITYFMFVSEKHISELFDRLDIRMPINSTFYVLVIVYSAIAYLLGIILQEIGKMVVERLPRFEVENTEKMLCDQKAKPRGFRGRILKENASIIKNTIPSQCDDQVSFDVANSWLKYETSVSTGRIDKLHAAYALSRSLALCFGGHLLFQGFAFVFLNASLKTTVTFLIVDTVLGALFWGRTFRYHVSWIRNVLIQYTMCKGSSDGGSKSAKVENREGVTNSPMIT